MKIKNLFFALLALPLFLVACEENNAVDQIKDPTIKVTAITATETTLSFTIESTEATKVAYLVVEGSDVPTASEVFANGTEVEANKSVEVTAEGLKASTTYVIAAAVQNSKATEKDFIQMTTLSTIDPGPGGDEPGGDEPGGDEPGNETDKVEFVATHIVTDYTNEDGLHIYAFELGDNTWKDNGWGVDGGTYYCFAIVSGSKGNGVLPNGTYTLDSSYGVNTIIEDYTYRYQMENGDLVNGFEMFNDANLTITDGKIEANIEMANGDIHHVVFEGALTVGDGGTDVPVEFEATHTATKWLWGGASNYGNKYAVVGDDFSIDVHFPSQYATENTLATGLYTWTSTSWWGYNDFIDFTTRTFVVNGTSVAVDAGTVVVEAEGDVYHIELTLEGRDGFVYMIEYNGKLNDKGEVGGEESSVMAVQTLSEGTYNNYYYFYTFKAAGENFSFDLLINDYDAKASAILAGDYTYAPGKSYTGSDGCFFIDNFKYDGVTYKASETSTMSVATTDNTNVEITLNLVMNTGDEFVVVYNGVVGGSAHAGEPAEPTKLATPSVSGVVAGNAATISWQEITGAKDYTVTLNGTDVQTVSTAYIVYQNLEYDTTYSVSVVANSSNEALYISSDAGTATFTTEAAPAGGDEGGSDTPTASYEDWVFDATLDMGSLLVTCTDGSHTVAFQLDQLSGGTFYINNPGVLNITEVTVNGNVTEDASGTVTISTNLGYRVVLDCYINGVHYTGTSTNPVV